MSQSAVESNSDFLDPLSSLTSSRTDFVIPTSASLINQPPVAIAPPSVIASAKFTSLSEITSQGFPSTGFNKRNNKAPSSAAAEAAAVFGGLSTSPPPPPLANVWAEETEGADAAFG
jgi:hypothetical protein